VPQDEADEQDKIDKASPATLTDQLVRLLRRRIERGEWQPGQQLPSEADLIEYYEVSRITVRAALKKLHEDHLIHPAQGRGWFVSRPEDRHPSEPPA
jgi:DNA-binding GntR family transcriptional regulator